MYGQEKNILASNFLSRIHLRVTDRSPFHLKNNRYVFSLVVRDFGGHLMSFNRL